MRVMRKKEVGEETLFWANRRLTSFEGERCNAPRMQLELYSMNERVSRINKGDDVEKLPGVESIE